MTFHRCGLAEILHIIPACAPSPDRRDGGRGRPLTGCGGLPRRRIIGGAAAADDGHENHNNNENENENESEEETT